MAALKTSIVLVLVLALAPCAARAQGAPSPAPAGTTPTADAAAAPATAPGDAAALVRQAEAALGDTEYETARDLADRALAAHGPPPPADGESAAYDAWTAVAVRALDIGAQARAVLKDTAGAMQMVDRMLHLAPGYRVDVASAGPKYEQLVEGQRKKLVGYIVATCVPGPCETVEIDGRAVRPGPDGVVAVIAGTHAVAVSRRNFNRAVADSVAVAAGARVPVHGPLELVSRDLRVATRPAGATVFVDRRAVGTTAAGSTADGPSAPLVVEGLPPGQHAITVEAPCFRHVEQAVDIVLDAQDLAPQDAGTIELQRARGVIDISWDGSGATLAIDGQPVGPGAHDVCPGTREVSLTVAGRRLWFERVEVEDDESITVTPRPRPTLAVDREGSPGGLPAGVPSREWNEVALTRAGAVDLLARITPRAAGAPMYPQGLRGRIEGLGAAARAAAPEADLVALALAGSDPVRPMRVMALVDTRRDLFEATAWPETDAKAANAIAAEVNRALRLTSRAFGVDVVERAGRAPVLAAVLAGTPAAAAGLQPGQEVAGVAGQPISSPADLERIEAALATDAPVVFRVVDKGTERAVEVAPVTVVFTPDPATLQGEPGRLLLPALARAEGLRAAGTPHERVAAGAFHALALAALGADDEAPNALDRAVVDRALDPAGDARGTIAFVLERLLRRLDRRDFANEVRARWTVLPDARLGGRRGPPLRAAAERAAD